MYVRAWSLPHPFSRLCTCMKAYRLIHLLFVRRIGPIRLSMPGENTAKHIYHEGEQVFVVVSCTCMAIVELQFGEVELLPFLC